MSFVDELEKVSASLAPAVVDFLKLLASEVDTHREALDAIGKSDTPTVAADETVSSVSEQAATPAPIEPSTDGEPDTEPTDVEGHGNPEQQNPG